MYIESPDQLVFDPVWDLRYYYTGSNKEAITATVATRKKQQLHIKECTMVIDHPMVSYMCVYIPQRTKWSYFYLHIHNSL